MSEKLAHQLLDRLQTLLLSQWEGWQQEHPLVAFFVNHPLLSAIAIAFLVLLVAGLVQAIGRVFENVWLRIFEFPGWLVGVLFRRGTALTTEALKDRKQRQREEILAKLQQLRAEQEALMQELERSL